MKRKWNFSVSKVLMSSIAALLAASGVYGVLPADPCNPPKPVCCDKPAPGPYAFAYEKDLGLSCPSNFYISAELLVMQPKMDGMEYGIENSKDPNDAHPGLGVLPLYDGDLVGHSTSHHNWDWNYGFRANLGFTLNHDAWNVDFGWTYLRIKEDSSDVMRGSGGVVPLWLPPTAVNQGVSGSQRWTGDLNAFDIQLGKAFHVSRYLILDPFFGVRAAWIDQHILSRYFGTFEGLADTIDPEMENRNDFWGMGSRVGLDTEWLLNGGWKLIAKASASLLYGKFDVKEQSALIDNQIDMHHEFYTTVPTVDMALGVAWGLPFADDRYHFDIGVAYEFHEWFSQNRMRRFFSHNYSVASNDAVSNGDLSFNGFSFKVQFDF